jgi:hypothetical protein
MKDEEVPKRPPVIDTVSGRDQPNPAIRTPQKPFWGDLDINNPVVDDCKQLSSEST